MKVRLFEDLPFLRRSSDDGRRSSWNIVCGQCGTTENLGAQGLGPQIACEQLPKRAQSKGWLVGKKARDHICPACIKSVAAKRANIQEDKMAETKTVVPLRADPPREMSREDRRIVFAKLDEVYVNETIGYSAGWTDKLVAEDLGVPRAWVATVRDENFGPASNEEIETVIREVRAAAAEVRGLNGDMSAIKHKIGEYANSLAATMERIAKLEKKANEIEKSVR